MDGVSPIVSLKCWLSHSLLRQSVGCDNVLGSGKKNDRCGKCDGDSSTCGVSTGEYDESQCKTVGV